MLISQAFANPAPTVPAPAGSSDVPAAASLMGGASGQFILIGIMCLMFYMLLIRPQQKRLKAQQSMLAALQVGDRVVTGGGLLGTVTTILSDTEVEVDLGSMKVRALRYTLSKRDDTSGAKAA